MSRAHLDCIERLAADCRALLGELAAGRAPDLEGFGDRRQALLAQLGGLGELSPASPLAEECHAALARLGALVARVRAELERLRDGVGGRLSHLQRGRRGLAGYRTAHARHPGARHGLG